MSILEIKKDTQSLIIFTPQELHIYVLLLTSIPLFVIGFVQDYMGKDAWIKWISENWCDTNCIIWVVLTICCGYIAYKFLRIAQYRGMVIESKLEKKESNG